MQPEPELLPDDNILVIGEGVVLDLQPTSFATRVLTGLIDYFCLGVLLVGTLIGMSVLMRTLDMAAAMALYLALTVGVLVGLPTLIETLTRGKSLGRLILGCRVVRDDGGAIRLRHAVIRSMVAFFEIWALWGAPAVFSTLVTAKGKRVGDLLAGTYVVRERGYRPREAPIQMPPHLQAWAGAADIGRMPDQLAMNVRQFLVRTATLAPHARAQMGTELAEAVASRVSPAPPLGTDPESFLAAVIAERRAREFARLQREQQAAFKRAETLRRIAS